MEVRQLDVTGNGLRSDKSTCPNALGAALQHIPEGDEVLDRLCSAMRPGALIVLEEGDLPVPVRHPQRSRASSLAGLKRIVTEAGMDGGPFARDSRQAARTG